MTYIPTSAHTVLVDDLKPFLTPDEQTKFQELLYSTSDQICEFLNSCTADIPPIREVYYHHHNNGSKDLSHGKFYAVFDEEDLFVKTPTPGLRLLNSKNVNPKFSRWSVCN